MTWRGIVCCLFLRAFQFVYDFISYTNIILILFHFLFGNVAGADQIFCYCFAAKRRQG
jgi:hypothetical protein